MSEYTPLPWDYEKLEPGCSATRWEPGDPGYPAVVFVNHGDESIEIAQMMNPGYVEEPQNEYDDGWRSYGDPNANAAFIVQACNAFNDLLAACKLAKEHLDALRLDAGVGDILTEGMRETYQHVDDTLTTAIAEAETAE